MRIILQVCIESFQYCFCCLFWVYQPAGTWDLSSFNHPATGRQSSNLLNHQGSSSSWMSELRIHNQSKYKIQELFIGDAFDSQCWSLGYLSVLLMLAWQREHCQMATRWAFSWVDSTLLLDGNIFYKYDPKRSSPRYSKFNLKSLLG